MSEKRREIRIQIHGRIREKNIVLTGPYGAGKSSSVFFFSELNIFPFIESFFKGFIVMREKSEIIILRRKSGCLTEHLLYMATHRN